MCQVYLVASGSLLGGREDAESMAVFVVEAIAGEDLVVAQDLARAFVWLDVGAAMGHGVIPWKEVLGEQL